METFLHRRSQFHSVHTPAKASKFHRRMLHSPIYQTQPVLICRCLNPCLCLHLNNKAIPSISEVYWRRTIQNSTTLLLFNPSSLPKKESITSSFILLTHYLLARMKTTHPITSTNLVKAKAYSQAVAKSHSLRTENFGNTFFLWLSSLFCFGTKLLF